MTPVIAAFPPTVSIQILSAAACAESSSKDRPSGLSNHVAMGFIPNISRPLSSPPIRKASSLSDTAHAENPEVERGRMLSDKYDRYLLTVNNKLKKRRA